jgi:hypothetical protein
VNRIKPARSTRALAALLAAVAALAKAAPATAVQDTSVTAFVDVNVIPMDRDRVIERQTVLVRGDRIEQVGPAASITVPANARRIDGRGKFLMPGLAEMHAHLPGGQAPPQVIQDILYLYIANGITSIRGMLGAPNQFEWKARAHRNEIVAPFMLLAGPSLNQNSVTDPASAKQVVQQNKDAGYDLQKVHPFAGRAAYDSAVSLARRLGFTLAGHVPTEVGLMHALEVKQDIDHLDGYLEAAVSPQVQARIAHPTDVITWGEILAGIDESRIPALVRASVQAGIYNTPTMYLWENIWGEINVDSITSLPEMRYVSRQQVQAWKNQKTQRQQFDAQQGITSAQRGQLIAFRRKLLKALADANAPVLMGTDSPQMFNVPGFALHHELHLMAAAGLTPFQVLRTGTSNVGRYVREVLKQPGDFGTVAAGQRADLVLLEANPLAGLSALNQRAGVMARGRWFDAAQLAAGLAEIARRNAQ